MTTITKPTLEEITGVKLRTPNKPSLQEIIQTKKPTLDEIIKPGPFEPNQADLEIYRRMGLKEYVSPSGRKYPLDIKTQINPLTGKPRKVFPAPTEWLRTQEVPEVLSQMPRRTDAIRTLKQIPSQLVGGTQEMVGTVGTMMRFAAEKAKIGEVATKHINIPGVGPLSEYLIRKYGPKAPMKFYDKKMKDYAGMGEKWADFWEEQANKGWDAPDPEIMEARWRDMPVEKGVATISRAAPNYLAAIASSVLTKSPQTGLMFISSVSGAGAYRRQRKAGAGVLKSQIIAGLTGAWEYVTEKVPFDEVFKPAKSKFLKMLKLGTMESAQEFVQGIGENFLEYFGYKAKDLKSVPDAVKEGLAHTMDGWVENVVAGAGLGVMGGGIIPKRGLTKPTLEEIRHPEAIPDPETPVSGRTPEITPQPPVDTAPKGKIKLFRGEMATGQEGNYFSTDKEWARQFTQSGQDKEIRTITFEQSDIFRKEPLPKAAGWDETDIDSAIEEAKEKGFKAIWVDEGPGQPDSVFMIEKPVAEPPVETATEAEKFGIKALQRSDSLKGITDAEALNIIRSTDQEEAVKDVLRNRGVDVDRIDIPAYPPAGPEELRPTIKGQKPSHQEAINLAVEEAMRDVTDVIDVQMAELAQPPVDTAPIDFAKEAGKMRPIGVKGIVPEKPKYKVGDTVYLKGNKEYGPVKIESIELTEADPVTGIEAEYLVKARDKSGNELFGQARLFEPPVETAPKRKYFTLSNAKNLIRKNIKDMTDSQLQKHIVKLRDYKRYMDYTEVYGDILVDGGYFAELQDPSGATGVVPKDMWLHQNTGTALDEALAEKQRRIKAKPPVETAPTVAKPEVDVLDMKNPDDIAAWLKSTLQGGIENISGKELFNMDALANNENLDESTRRMIKAVATQIHRIKLGNESLPPDKLAAVTGANENYIKQFLEPPVETATLTSEQRETDSKALSRRLITNMLEADETSQGTDRAFADSGYVKLEGFWVAPNAVAQFKQLSDATKQILRDNGVVYVNDTTHGKRVGGAAALFQHGKQRIKGIGISWQGEHFIGGDQVAIHELGHAVWEDLTEEQQNAWRQGEPVTKHGKGVKDAIEERYTEAYGAGNLWAEEDFAQAYVENNADLEKTLSQKAQPPVETAKEPWEMTRKEYYESSIKTSISHGLSEQDARDFTDKAELEKQHRSKVLMATLEKESVPREVLQEYKSEKWAQEALKEKKVEPKAEKVGKLTKAEQAEFEKLKSDFNRQLIGFGSPESKRLVELERKSLKAEKVVPPKVEGKKGLISRAIEDWNTKRLYIDNNGNWHLRPEGNTSGKGPIAPYNKELKRTVSPDTLHSMAQTQKKAEQPPAQVKGKRVISEKSYQAAKKRLTDRTTLRMGVDPQGFADLVTIGAYHVENGLRTFAAWSKKMIEVYGESVKPQLKKVWNQVRPLTMEEFNEFPKQFLSEQQRTKAEMGEIPSEGEFKSQSGAFNEHLDYFQKRQLPKTSKIPAIQARMRTINGLRLAGKVSAKSANKAIIELRQHLFKTAIDEGVALRMTKGGKVSLSVRKAGTYVPEEFAQHSFKNIRPILGGGQDITRAVQQMDGSLSIKEKVRTRGQAGPLERHVLWPTRDISLQKLNYIKEKTAELKSIFKTRKGTKEDEQVNLVLEKIAKEDRDTPIKDILNRKTLREIASPQVIRQAIKLREYYDSVIEEQNLAREMRDQDPIPYRHNYSPHILRDTTIWERLMMRGKKPKDIKADLPDYIKPNAPFNPRAMAREAGIKYEERIKSAQRLAESYLVTAAKDIFNTSIVQNNKAFIQQIEAMGYDKSANYLADWTAESYAGVKPRLDRAIQIGRKGEKAARYFNRLRNMAVFPFNFSWSLLTQTSSLALTVGRYGTPNTLRGFVQWLNPNVRKQAAEDYYSYVVKSERQGKITRQDAQNLIGQTVKLRRSPTELAYDFSTLLLEQLEKLLTGTSIRAAHLHGKKRGLTGEALRNYASDGGAKTQSMYNDEDKPALLRNLLVKTGAPYQTFAYEVANTMREWAGRTGTPPDSKLYTIWTITRFLAAAAVFAAIGKKFGKKEIWSWKRPPIPFAEFWLNPIIRILSNQWIGSASGLTSPIETATRVAKGIDDVIETGSWRKLRNELIKYGPGILGVPGGVQLSRTVDAIIAYAQGGVKDRKGRLMFKMEDPQDLAQAIFSGVWSTKGGQEYLEPELKWQRMTIAELQKEIRDNEYDEVNVKIINGKRDVRYAHSPHRGSEKKVKRMKEILAKKKK